MPYVNASDKDQLTKNVKFANHGGHWNFLYSIAFLEIWKNHRTYAVAHAIRKYIIKAQDDPRFPQLRRIKDVDNQLIVTGIRATDLQTAKEMAFMEFYRRIVVEYEKKKMKQNGDIYAEEIKWIKEME